MWKQAFCEHNVADKLVHTCQAYLCGCCDWDNKWRNAGAAKIYKTALMAKNENKHEVLMK